MKRLPYDLVDVTEVDTVGDVPVVITRVVCPLGECKQCDKARGVHAWENAREFRSVVSTGG